MTWKKQIVEKGAKALNKSWTLNVSCNIHRRQRAKDSWKFYRDGKSLIPKKGKKDAHGD